MKAKLFIYLRMSASLTLGCLVVSCASSPQDQFGIAVARGSVPMAAANNGPNYANMQIWKSPRQYAVPMQYAILQGNKPMASFLLANGAHHSLDGKNLAHYSAASGRRDMARYFISRGIGSESDLTRGESDIAANQRSSRASAQAATLIGLSILGAMMSSGGGSEYKYNSSGMTEDEQRGWDNLAIQQERERSGQN